MNSLRSRIELLIFQPPPFDPSINSTRAKDMRIQYIPIYFPLIETSESSDAAEAHHQVSSTGALADSGVGVGESSSLHPTRDKSFLSYVYRVLGNATNQQQQGVDGGEVDMEFDGLSGAVDDEVSPKSGSSSSAASKTPKSVASASSSSAPPQKGGWLRSLWAGRGAGKQQPDEEIAYTAVGSGGGGGVRRSRSPNGSSSPIYNPPASNRTPNSLGGTPLSTGSSRRQRFRAYKASQEGTPMSSDGGGVRHSGGGGYVGLSGGTPMSTTSTLDEGGVVPWKLSKQSSSASLRSPLRSSLEVRPTATTTANTRGSDGTPPAGRDGEVFSSQGISRSSTEDPQPASSTTASPNGCNGASGPSGIALSASEEVVVVSGDTSSGGGMAAPVPLSTTAPPITFASSGTGSTKAGRMIGHAPSGVVSPQLLHEQHQQLPPPIEMRSSLRRSLPPPTGRISYIHVKCVEGAPTTASTTSSRNLSSSSASTSAVVDQHQPPPKPNSDKEGCGSANDTTPLPPPPPPPSSQRQRFTILFSHGNADDLPSSFYYYQRLANEVQCNVVAWDYLGYGFSSGDKSEAKADCTEKNAFRGVQAVYDHMTTTMRIEPKDVILMGRSLGSGSAVELALRLHNRQSKEDKANNVSPFGGLILASALWSAISVVGYKLAFMGGLMDIMKNKNKISSIRRVPIFIIHGDQDEVVPYDHGKSLFEAVFPKYNSNVSMWTVSGRGHNDIEYRSADEYFRRIHSFAYGKEGNGRAPKHTNATAGSSSNKNVSASSSGAVGLGKAKKGVLEDDKDADMWKTKGGGGGGVSLSK